MKIWCGRIVIPFNKPFVIDKEIDYIKETIESGVIRGDGEFSAKCHNFLQENLPAKKVLLTHSCTAALEMAAILADIKVGDEVIMPSYTFVSTANPVFHYIPLHSSPAGMKFARTCGDMQATNQISDTLVRMPLFYGLCDENMHTIKSVVREFFENFR